MLFRQLQYLTALSQEKHFGRAAERCNVSQPSLSSAIKQLEYSLGVPIVLRGRRFLGFTPEGTHVVKWAKRMAAQRNALLVELSYMRNNLEGQIRIGAMPNSSPILPLLSKALTERHPDVEIFIQFLSVEELRLQLSNFTLDVGVTYTDKKLLGELNAMPIYTEQLSLLVPKDSEWAHLESITWEHAATLPLCLLGKNMHERRIVDEAFARAQATPKTIVTVSDSTLNLIFHVMYAGMVTVVPSHFERFSGRLPGIKAIQLLDPNIEREVGLVWSPTEPTASMAKVMVSIVQALCKSDQINRQLTEPA